MTVWWAKQTLDDIAAQRAMIERGEEKRKVFGGKVMEPIASANCDECGGNVGPFVKFGGGTMASEDCVICTACISKAHASMDGRWIAVSERLPEDGQSVIACFTGGGIAGEVGEAVFSKAGGWFSTEHGAWAASHWMPLPAPPPIEAK